MESLGLLILVMVIGIVIFMIAVAIIKGIVGLIFSFIGWLFKLLISLILTPFKWIGSLILGWVR